MNKVINFQAAAAKRTKIHYIIEIGEDEKPVYVAAELEPGEITIMVRARTLEEAETLRKEAEAIAKQAQRSPAAGGTVK